MTPARAPRSQLLPRCARQVELPEIAGRCDTHTVNDLSTLPGTGAFEAAGSVADISTLLPQGRAPPRRTLARAVPSPCCCSRWPPRSRRMGRPRAQKPRRAGPDPHAWEGLSCPSCTEFFALFVGCKDSIIQGSKDLHATLSLLLSAPLSSPPPTPPHPLSQHLHRALAARRRRCFLPGGSTHSAAAAPRPRGLVTVRATRGPCGRSRAAP